MITLVIAFVVGIVFHKAFPVVADTVTGKISDAWKALVSKLTPKK